MIILYCMLHHYISSQSQKFKSWILKDGVHVLNWSIFNIFLFIQVIVVLNYFIYDQNIYWDSLCSYMIGNLPEIECSKSFSENTNNEFSCTGCQKFNNCGVANWKVWFIAPLHDVFWNIVSWWNNLNLRNFAIWMEECWKQ